MKISKIFSQWLGSVIWIISVILIVLLTLYPFNFINYSQDFSIKLILGGFYHTSYFNDMLFNVILFIPFGLSSTFFLNKFNSKWLLNFILIAVISFTLSFIVEALQIFLPTRNSTISDLFCNAFGGLLGSVFFYLLKVLKIN